MPQGNDQHTQDPVKDLFAGSLLHGLIIRAVRLRAVRGNMPAFLLQSLRLQAQGSVQLRAVNDNIISVSR